MRPGWILAAALTGCAPGLAPSCQVIGGHPQLVAQLLFGAGTTTPAAWAGFLAGSVTPRFPAGLTVLDGQGQWTSPAGRLEQEPSKLLLIVTAPGPASIAGLQAIRDEYRVRFHQQSVGLVLTEGCAAF